MRGIVMGISKTSKVWLAALGGGALTAAGGVLCVTGVGVGAGAVLITSGLKVIGASVVGGGMLAGLGVLGAGTATGASIAAAIAHKAIKDPELIELAEKLKKANELYEAGKMATVKQKSEIEDLNRQVGELLRSKKKDKEKLDVLKARLIVLIRDMQKAA